MRVRSRRAAQVDDQTMGEGPFVSFTDLFIGILFLFLILVAALMLMHQQAMAEARAEIARQAEIIEEQAEEIERLLAELERLRRLDLDHPPYRLAMVFNSYQRPEGDLSEWKFSRTVQVFRTDDGICIQNVILRNNLNLGWKPALTPEDIPTSEDIEDGTPCTITPTGESWATETETGGVERVSPDLYAGSTVLHSENGESTVNIQYRIIGIYDDYYRNSGTGRVPEEIEPAEPSQSFSLN